MTFLDTNILVDIATSHPVWASWSLHQMEAAALRGSLVVNPIVYAELSAGYAQAREVDTALASAEIDIAEMPRSVLFLAGQAFKAYRARRGLRTSVLSDFFIGAHAAMLNVPLITRDPRRYRSYFPTLELITPQ